MIKKTAVRLVLAAALAGIAGPVLAVQETVITVTPMMDGTERTDVTTRERPPTPPDLSFEWADRNHDGRIDRKEAKDMGIMSNTFSRHAGRKGYLTREEYEQAITE